MIDAETQTPAVPPAKAAFGWLRTLSPATLAPVPAAMLALLPSFTCPVCIAAYAGVLSAAGLGFIFDTTIQTPLIIGFLLIGIASVAFASRSHRKPAPLLLTLLGAAAVVAGKLVWDVPYVLYSGAALLLGAAIYNLWLKRPKRRAATEPRCNPSS
ncbi:MerC domain-containing protein [Desulfobulbus sp. AH-315-M07]|nr:MerC domain-containing protein [Desulfobulbus sp. AH-315-M07]